MDVQTPARRPQHTSRNHATYLPHYVYRDLFHNHATLTFDLVFLSRLAAAMVYICTNFGVDSSSRFPFRKR